jgi:hypothetical protein
MEKINSIFNKEYRTQLFLAILIIIFIVLGFKTPDFVANIIDTLPGKVIIFIVVILLFTYYHPALAVIALLAAFLIIQSSSEITGEDALQKYAPTEKKRTTQFTAYNQFPYTLEQEIVAKMAPVVQSGSSISHATYKPLLEDLHNASSVCMN